MPLPAPTQGGSAGVGCGRFTAASLPHRRAHSLDRNRGGRGSKEGLPSRCPGTRNSATPGPSSSVASAAAAAPPQTGPGRVVPSPGKVKLPVGPSPALGWPSLAPAPALALAAVARPAPGRWAVVGGGARARGPTWEETFAPAPNSSAPRRLTPGLPRPSGRPGPNS